ncbi:hypothetical protein ACQY0O_003876 [Thecaphora frezii]
MAIVYPTTPANYFHMLQRQVRSKIEDFLPGTGFQRFIAKPHAKEGKDALVVLEQIKRHILMCPVIVCRKPPAVIKYSETSAGTTPN